MKIFVNNVNISYSIYGKGYPILFLHGYPQSKLMWRKVIPYLSKKYTVVTSDLRGYGDSDKPSSTKNHDTYSKKTMAKDQMLLLNLLGGRLPLGHRLVGMDVGMLKQKSMDDLNRVIRRIEKVCAKLA